MAEYDYEMDMAVKQEEARDEGRKEGRQFLLDELEVDVQVILEYIQK